MGRHKLEVEAEPVAVEPIQPVAAQPVKRNENAERVHSEWTQKLKESVEAAKAESVENKEVVPAEDEIKAKEALSKASLAKAEAVYNAILNKTPIDVDALSGKGDVDKKPADDKTGESEGQEDESDESLLAEAEQLGMSTEEAAKLSPGTRAKLIDSLGKGKVAAKEPEYSEADAEELRILESAVDPELFAKVKGLINAKGKEAFEVGLQLKRLQDESNAMKLKAEGNAFDSYVNGLSAEPEWESVFGRGTAKKLKDEAPEKFKARSDLWDEKEKQKKLGKDSKQALTDAFFILHGRRMVEINSARKQQKLVDYANKAIAKPTVRSAEAISKDNGTPEGRRQTWMDVGASILNKITGK